MRFRWALGGSAARMRATVLPVPAPLPSSAHHQQRPLPAAAYFRLAATRPPLLGASPTASLYHITACLTFSPTVPPSPSPSPCLAPPLSLPRYSPPRRGLKATVAVSRRRGPPRGAAPVRGVARSLQPKDGDGVQGRTAPGRSAAGPGAAVGMRLSKRGSERLVEDSNISNNKTRH